MDAEANHQEQHSAAQQDITAGLRERGFGSRSVTAVGIVTRDRETSLAPCLASYLANCRRHARSPEFVVVDGAAGEEGSGRVRAALRALAAASGATIRYAGPAEKKRFADALVRESSVSGEIVDFALFGDRRCRLSTGANRNSLLLDTLDTLVFSVDDDTLCRTAVAPQPQESVAFVPAYDPTEYWFFPDRRGALEFARVVETDLLGRHEELLGRPLADFEATGALTGRVAITLPGLVGDSGMGSPRYYLTLSGPSRARLLHSRTAYLSALRSREVLRTVPQPTIAASAFCMTTFFGFDNRLLLPPFFPVERNSDGIFGLMVHRSVTGSHVAFMPWLLLHAPSEPRAFDGDEAWTEAEGVKIADILIACITSHAGSADVSAAARFQSLGKYLGDLASLRLDDFEAFVTAAQQLRNLAATTLLETRLREHRASPAFWADDVRRTIDALRGTVTKRDYIVPRELRNADDAKSARRITPQLVAKFGGLLEAWPALVEAARRLRMKGCRVSEPL